MLDSHGPQGGIRSLRPVDGGVDHHRAGDGHNNPDRMFSNPIMVMGAHSSEADYLFEAV
jgi:hypothetical protein